MSWEGRIAALYEGLDDDPDYLMAQFVLEVTEEICRRMEEEGLTQKEVAGRLGTSQAYVAKVLNNHPNMTVRSLIALANAVGLKVDGVRLVDKKTGWLYADTGRRQIAHWSEILTVPGHRLATLVGTSYTEIANPPVEQEYADERIADAA